MKGHHEMVPPTRRYYLNRRLWEAVAIEGKAHGWLVFAKIGFECAVWVPLAEAKVDDFVELSIILGVDEVQVLNKYI